MRVSSVWCAVAGHQIDWHLIFAAGQAIRPNLRSRPGLDWVGSPKGSVVICPDPKSPVPDPRRRASFFLCTEVSGCLARRCHVAWHRGATLPGNCLARASTRRAERGDLHCTIRCIARGAVCAMQAKQMRVAYPLGGRGDRSGRHRIGGRGEPLTDRLWNWQARRYSNATAQKWPSREDLTEFLARQRQVSVRILAKSRPRRW
jgi:hypothetical protein